MRRATGRDVDAVVALWLRLVRHQSDLAPGYRLCAGAERELARHVAKALSDPEAAIFVWDEAGELLGFASSRLRPAPPLLEAPQRGEIDELLVLPEARRGGIGRGLVETSTAWLRERGARSVEVRVLAANEEGQAFWQALGYGAFVDVLRRPL